MSDESKELRVSDVPYSHKSPWLVSRRTFLGMMAGSGTLCAGEVATSTGRSPTGSAGESDPVNLLPRLTPTPERVAGRGTQAANALRQPKNALRGIAWTRHSSCLGGSLPYPVTTQ
jgi:hypothetical protein